MCQFRECENDYGADHDLVEREKKQASAVVVFPLFARDLHRDPKLKAPASTGECRCCSAGTAFS